MKVLSQRPVPSADLSPGTRQKPQAIVTNNPHPETHPASLAHQGHYFGDVADSRSAVWPRPTPTCIAPRQD